MNNIPLLRWKAVPANGHILLLVVLTVGQIYISTNLSIYKTTTHSQKYERHSCTEQKRLVSRDGVSGGRVGEELGTRITGKKYKRNVDVEEEKSIYNVYKAYSKHDHAETRSRARRNSIEQATF